jgi:E3 ubiquitin-protein ligase HECTD1
VAFDLIKEPSNKSNLLLSRLALKLHTDYLQQAQDKPRELALRLVQFARTLRQACLDHDAGHPEALAAFSASLSDLRVVLAEKTKSISSHELSTSGLVPALLHALLDADRQRVFLDALTPSLLAAFLHKLISLLESVERLPLYLYDAPGSYNLQAFSKRFKLTLHQGDQSGKLRNGSC